MSELIETEIGILPSNWIVSKIIDEASLVTDYVANGSFASLKENVTYNSNPDYAILVRLVDFSRNFTGDFVYVNEHSYNFLKKSKLLGGEIIISNVGEYAGTVFRAPKTNKPMTLGPNSIMVNFKHGNNFYYYWFRSPQGQHILQSIRTGSAIPKFNKTDFRNSLIPVPPLNQQTAIAEVLSSLDDKINLLHRQNKTLEELTETLFRQWFDDKSNKSQSVALRDYVETVNGVSYKSSELNPSRTAMVSLKSFDRTGGFRIDGFKEFTGKYKEKQIVHEGDLIVAHTDITQEAEVIGNPALVLSHPHYDTLVISMDIVKVLPKLDWISIEFIYYLMKTREFKGHCEANANGSTVLHLSKQAIPTFEFPLPDKSFVKEFTGQARKLIQKIFLNHKQIRTLVSLRDTLLPKLMSGEVRID